MRLIPGLSTDDLDHIRAGSRAHGSVCSVFYAAPVERPYVEKERQKRFSGPAAAMVGWCEEKTAGEGQMGDYPSLQLCPVERDRDEILAWMFEENALPTSASPLSSSWLGKRGLIARFQSG